MYPIILLTQTEMKARWDKDLCYNCDEVYSFKHRCAKIQLYMLKDEEEGDEGEVENTEIVFDSAEELIEVPDPEPTPIKAICGSDLVSPMLNLTELEGVKPEPEPEPRPLVKEIKPPDSTMVTGLSQLQEVPAEASIDAKETKSWPKPTPNPNPYTPPINLPIQIQPTQSFNQSTKTINLSTDPTPNLPTLPYPNRGATITPPNQNLPTLSYPNPNTAANQTQSSQTSNQNIEAFLDANRPEPWPNKPSINTNPNRPNPWPNKLPKLTYFIRPKPWPDEPPIYTIPKPRNRSKETKEIREVRTQSTMVLNRYLQQVKEGKAYQFQLLVESESDDQAMNLFNGRQGSDSRLSVANRALNRFQNRVLTVAQLRVMVIAILRHLPEFDPGDLRSKEDEGRLDFDCNGDFGHFGRIFEGFRRRIKERSHRFSERRRIGNGEVLGCEFGGDVANFRGESTPDKGGKKIWEFLSNDRLLFVMEEDLGVILVDKVNDLGVVLVGKVKELGVVLMEACTKKEEDLCCVEGRRNEEEKVLGLLSETKRDFVALTLNLKLETVSFCISLLGTRNGGVLKGISVGLVGAARRIGSSTDWATIATGFPYQLMGQLGHYSPLGCICNYWSAIQWTLGKLVNNRIGPIGPLLQLVTNWATCNWFFHINSLANWVTNSQFQVSILEDKDVFKERGMSGLGKLGINLGMSIISSMCQL